MADDRERDVVIVGGGLAGMSAAIYLARGLRDTLLVDADRPMAFWEFDVQNYLGFPEGISGQRLIERGRRQLRRFGVERVIDQVESASGGQGHFELVGRQGRYRAKRVLLATGIFHLPPAIAGSTACIGHSVFFCKDCDAYRVRGRRVAVFGRNDAAAEYALGLLAYTPHLVILTHGCPIQWQPQFDAWLQEYGIPICHQPVTSFEHDEGYLHTIRLADGTTLSIDCVFTVRGDRYHNTLAQELGADCDGEGQVAVDSDMQTTVPGVYAAGCVTPANCQMIIAAGQGATAAQAINRSLLEESLATHRLPRHRGPDTWRQAG